MIRSKIVMLSVCAILLPQTVLASSKYKVGDRVMIGTTKELGTVSGVDEAKRITYVKMDNRPIDEARPYFSLSPDLQLSNAPVPAGAAGGIPAPNNAAGNNAAANNAPQNKAPADNAAPFVPMKPIVGGNLTEEIVKKLVTNSFDQGVDHSIERLIMQFNSVNIGGLTKFSELKADIEGIPPGADVYPVRVDFSKTLQSIKYPADKHGADRIAYGYFYQDEFKQWNFSWYAHTGTVNNVKHY